MTDLTEVVPAGEWAGRVKRSKSEQLHDKFAFDCKVRGLPEPRREFTFAREDLGRRWKFDFDFALHGYKLAVELEGLVILPMYSAPRSGAGRRFVVMGRHASADGIKEDMAKYNAAVFLGWYVLRFEQDAIKCTDAIDTTVRVLHRLGWRK